MIILVDEVDWLAGSRVVQIDRTAGDPGAEDCAVDAAKKAWGCVVVNVPFGVVETWCCDRLKGAGMVSLLIAQSDLISV